MRLFEIEDGQSEVDIADPLSSDVNSLILRLDASNVKNIKLENFIEELNNILNIQIDVNDIEQMNNIKKLIANTGKADIKGNYLIMNYQAPESPEESDTQKIAMKNIKDKVS